MEVKNTKTSCEEKVIFPGDLMCGMNTDGASVVGETAERGNTVLCRR